MALVGLLFAGCSARPGINPHDAGGAEERPRYPADGTPAELDGELGTRGDATQPDAQDCTIAAPPPNLALFTQLQADLAALADAAARSQRVDAFMAQLAQQSHYPLTDGTDVLFVYRGSRPQPISVAGSFNGWAPGADVLAAVPGTDLHVLSRAVGQQRVEYKLVDGAGQWFRDPLDRHVIWDGIVQAGLGDFNSVALPLAGPAPATGRLEWLRVRSAELGHERDVFVYLPAAYDADRCTRFPVLVVHDGNESLTRSQLDQVAASSIAAGKVAPTILVFVALASQADRLDEYSCEMTSRGPTYADFLCDTLVPLVDQRYRTTAKPEQRGLIGASMGGLISFAALQWRNDCFQRAGAQSGSFWFANQALVQRYGASSPKSVLLRAYLDNGSDNRASTLAMRDALQASGYPVFHWENLQHAHEWDHWRERFDEALEYLFPAGGP